jgi:hypothetical protein
MKAWGVRPMMRDYFLDGEKIEDSLGQGTEEEEHRVFVSGEG